MSIRRRGFTIVELLVVIGVTALLLGLLLPALSGVKRRMQKSQEVNGLRQVGIAWALYATANDDAILPGYLSVNVQESWRVTYRYADGSPVPPAPDYDGGLGSEDNVAGPWPWRLMSFLDHSQDLMLVHLDDRERDAMGLKDAAQTIRNEPAFAYNGLFVGGWWAAANFVLYDNGTVHGEDRRVSLVSRSVGGVRRPSELITFTTAAPRLPGVYKYEANRDDLDASYMVVPPNIGTHELWGLPRDLDAGGPGSPDQIVGRRGSTCHAVEFYGNPQWEEGDPTVPYG